MFAHTKLLALNATVASVFEITRAIASTARQTESLVDKDLVPVTHWQNANERRDGARPTLIIPSSLVFGLAHNARAGSAAPSSVGFLYSISYATSGDPLSTLPGLRLTSPSRLRRVHRNVRAFDSRSDTTSRIKGR